MSRKHEYKPTLVRRGASIGANATIVCGNEIGEYAFIGAGAVVTKPVPAYALVMGNPARQTGWISKHGHKLQFDKAGVATCPESGEIYKLETTQFVKINCNEKFCSDRRCRIYSTQAFKSH